MSIDRGHAGSRVWLIIGAVIAAVLTVALISPPEGAAKKKKKNAKVTVMTRNVYLGADLGPALGAPDIGAAIAGAGEIYNEIERTNFPERAIPLAKEIKKSKADLVGLQEVAHWRVQDPSDGGAPPISPVGELATETKYDFLKELMSHLDGKYKVIAVQDEFEGELPADVDGNPATGTGPLAFTGADLDARLTMRDVILARKGSKVKPLKKSVQMAQYENSYTADVGGVMVTANRGWLSVDAKYQKNKKSKPTKFRFVNTHLEAFGDPTIKEAQAKELTKKGGPLKTKMRAILVGDLNSALLNPHEVGDGGNSGTDGDQLAFKALKKFGMKDYGTGGDFTCCYGTPLDINEAPFDHTIDHVLANKKAKAKRLKAYVTGDDPGEITPSGLWPSDHGGAVSKLKLRK
jgi:endonuclease/exonuclease/phosphatase family metal-dependent hydrolase